MAETKERIMERLTDQLPRHYDVSAGTYTYDIEMAHAKEFENAYDIIDENYRQAHASTATGIYLDAFAEDIGLSRKQASAATGYVTIKGDSGAKIKLGDRVAAGSVIFNITEDAVIGVEGIITVPVICSAAGKIGNVKARYINYFPVTLQGIIAVYNEEPTSGGSDIETDDELRARYKEYMSHPITSGNKWQYIAWAKSIAGVGEAKCIPLWNGKGTVKVIIVDTENQPASEELVKSVHEYIEEQHPIGAEVTVVSAEAVNIDVSCKLVMNSDARDVITDSISAYLRSVSFNQGNIIYAKIGQLIMNADGVTDYSDLRINGGTENINIDDMCVARLGAVSFE